MEPDDLSLAAAREVMGWPDCTNPCVYARVAKEDCPLVYQHLGVWWRKRKPSGNAEIWAPERDIAQALEVAARATERGNALFFVLRAATVDVEIWSEPGEYGAYEACAPEDRLRVAARLITSAAVRMVRAAQTGEEEDDDRR